MRLANPIFVGASLLRATSKVSSKTGFPSSARFSSLAKGANSSTLLLQPSPFRPFSRPALPLSLHFVRHNSTQSSPSDQTIQNPEILNPLDSESLSALATVASDVTKIGDLHALGLGSYYTPVGLLQNTLEYLHVAGGLPWWGSIVAATVVARTFLLPLIIYQMTNAARLNNIKPQLEDLTSKMNAAFKQGDQETAAAHSVELQKLFKENKCSPLKGFLMPLMQAPIFVSFFFGIRKMAELPVLSMKTGGLSWFTDLTVPDPYYLLPVLTASTFLLTIELGTDGVSPQQKAQLKTIFRILAVAMVPITASFPAGLLTYWFTANLFSLSQFLVLKIPGLKGLLGIPESIVWESKSKKSEGFWDTMKAQYKTQLEEAEKIERLNQQMKRKKAQK